MLSYILQQTNLPNESVKNTLALLAEDCTIPFIARYRKERTGNLDEVQIEQIVHLKEQFEALEKRKKSILKAIEEQGELTTEISASIKSTSNLVALEDLYLPFKKKRKTKAETARKNGLEPLAKIIMAQNTRDLESVAQRYTNTNVPTIEDAFEGARHIVAEWINERTDIRNNIRKQLERFAVVSTKVVKSKKEEDKAQKFRDYFSWDESLQRCPSHRLLAILRAENEGFIRVKIEIEEERILDRIASKLISSRGTCADQIKEALEDAYKRLLFPALSNEILVQAKKKAGETAISIFAKNLKQLLLGSPLGEKRILAIDPGFRSGCKVVCLDAQGSFLHNDTIFPHPPKSDEHEAIRKISKLAETYNIEAIAIGNGTASRETEAIIKKIPFKNDVEIFIVSEAGASIYSASKIAREEFPDYDVTVRGAISIGRRLADPLAELVKIDAKSIGVGQYQHDVDQSQLKKSLDRVVENCVNAVGVNINTASVPLLSYVSGIGPKLAENIVEYRETEGAFTSRNEIKKVPRLGAKAFEQGAGFLRIRDAKNPLDNSSVHPERYVLIKEIAKDQGINVTELIGNTTALKNIALHKYCTEDVGILTLEDIIKELQKPGLDIRQKAKVFSFNQHIKTIEDLQPGMLLPGIVNNITAFGCFVDVGVKESGLIHVSNLSETFVKDVNEHVALQQQVIVKVLEVDVSRKRIQLKLKK
jgi:uncharacterized protein